VLKPSNGFFKKMFSPEKMAESIKKKKSTSKPYSTKNEGPLSKAINKKAE